MEIVTLRKEHLEDAGRLVSARYRLLRRELPLLPLCYEKPQVWSSMLEGIASAGPGVAALRGSKLAGFLTGWQIARLPGQRAVYTPEWANAADDSRRVYQEIYGTLSACWVADRYCDHYITLLPQDRDGIEAWQWLGFGHYAVDAMRAMEPAQGTGAHPPIRRTTYAELAQAVELRDGLMQHLAAAPTFLRFDPRAPDDFETWVNDPAKALWLAFFEGGEAVASLGLGPASHDACTIIRDEGTTSITNAFTREAARGNGVASALLNRALEWARAEGYIRCTVDFEAANVLAARFWLRHFRPVALSFYRHVNNAEWEEQ